VDLVRLQEDNIKLVREEIVWEGESSLGMADRDSKRAVVHVVMDLRFV
jgi:hypothetical protein